MWFCLLKIVCEESRDRLRNRDGIYTNELGSLRHPITGRLVGHADHAPRSSTRTLIKTLQ